MSKDSNIQEGENLLRMVLDSQPHKWSREGEKKLRKSLKKSKNYLPESSFDSVVALSQRVWNIFVKVTSDAENIGSWTNSEMTLTFKEVVSLDYLDFFVTDLSIKMKEEFGENLVYGLTRALESDLEAGHQHFLFLLCCCLYYGSQEI